MLCEQCERDQTTMTLTSDTVNLSAILFLYQNNEYSLMFYGIYSDFEV